MGQTQFAEAKEDTAALGKTTRALEQFFVEKGATTVVHERVDRHFDKWSIVQDGNTYILWADYFLRVVEIESFTSKFRVDGGYAESLDLDSTLLALGNNLREKLFG